jgi:hypothetical protein
MSYSLSSNFVPVEWYLAELWPLNLYFCSNFKFSSNLNCNSSRYSHRPNIKSIYQRTSKKSTDNLKFEQKIKLKFRSGRITFSWVMAIELVLFVQIWSYPHFSLTSFDILTWYLACGYINLKFEQKYKLKGHNSAKSHSTGTKFELKL